MIYTTAHKFTPLRHPCTASTTHLLLLSLLFHIQIFVKSHIAHLKPRNSRDTHVEDQEEQEADHETHEDS